MGQNAEKYWANPRLAYSELMALSSSNPKLFASERMQEAAAVLAELNSFGETHGLELPARASAEQPIDRSRLDLDQEYSEREASAGEVRTPAPAGPGESAEYRALQLKVATRGATEADHARLVEIAESYIEQTPEGSDEYHE